MSGYGATDPSVGLSDAEAKRRLAEFGPNELDAADKDTFLKILATQMTNFIFLLTTSASIICYATGDRVKGTFLIVLVVVVCLINAVGEYSGQDAGAALRAMSPENAKVWRDGSIQEVPVCEIVVDDVVELGTGTMVPADMQVLKCVDLQTNEACLTGEPREVNKISQSDYAKSGATESDPEALPPYMCYKNTEVVAGNGRALVTAIGMNTKVGLIAKRLKNPEMLEGHRQANSITKLLNPLQRSINQLGTMILICCLIVISIGVAASYFLRYQNLPPTCAVEDRACILYQAAVRGLLMAVAIIPHGLPLVVMTMLRVGSQLMAERNALVMRQSAVDYLGATQVICTDKTGTLTAGVMAAKILVGFHRGGKQVASLTQASCYPLKGLNPEGGIFPTEQLTSKVERQLDSGIPPDELGGDIENLGNPQVQFSGDSLPTSLITRASLTAAFINCHSCKIIPPVETHGKWKMEGSTTDAALKVAAWKGGLLDGTPTGIDVKAQYPLEESLEIPFSSSRKMSATVHKLPPGEPSLDEKLFFNKKYTHIAIVKGAPDRVLPKVSCMLEVQNGRLSIANGQMTDEERKRIEEQNGGLARQALRSILMAVRPLTAADMSSLQAAKGQVEARLNQLLGPGPLAFLSLWGIFDPPRSTVPPSVRMAHEAGIRVVMITGDQRPTAVAIGKLVGILPEKCDDRQLARPCVDMHLKDESMLRQISGWGRPEHRPSKRKLTVHDVKSKKDAHENEYVDTEDLAEMTSKVCVWSRAQPTDKVAIVDSLDWQELVVAMTGDGVNDAPALKRADIGVAMGIAGTPVTKNAADMVLKDDNFSTIVAAVAEGRKIYGNVQKYVIFNLSVKGAECAACMVAIFAGLPMPIEGLPQLVNLLFTHIIPPMALAWEDAEEYTMKIKPRDTKKDLVVNRVLMLFRWLPFIVVFTLVIVTSMVFYLWMETGFFTVRGLIGTPIADLFAGQQHACQVAGHINEDGKYITDLAPFHCVCKVRNSYWDLNPFLLDQWGRHDAETVPVDRWTAYTGIAFNLENTPWAGDGFNNLLEHCTGNDGVKRFCWRDPSGPKPLLDIGTNCAAWGSRIAKSMSYISVDLAEILSLATFRTDGFCGFARFSRTYTSLLILNICVLMCMVYVPFWANLLGLAPVSRSRFLVALMAPIAIMFANEIMKIEFRARLWKMHQLEASPRDKLEDV